MKEETPQAVSSLDKPTTINNVQSNQQPSQEKTLSKKSNKWLIIFIIIFFLIIIGVIGFFAYQNCQLKQNLTPEKTGLTISPTTVLELLPTDVTSPTMIPDPTADWLTDTTADLCYSFKYPKNITHTVRPDEKIVHLSLWGATQKTETEFYDGISLTFSFPLDLGGTGLSDYVDSQIEESKITGKILKSKETITLNGISAYTYTVQGLGIFKNIYLQSPDETCTVKITDATIDPANQGYNQTVNQIFSTFKFK